MRPRNGACLSTRTHWGRTRVTADDLQRSLGGPTRLRGVTLPCVDYAATRRFYTEGLGIRLTGQTRGHAVLDLGGTRLVLLDGGRVAGFQRKEGQGLYLELQVGDLDAVRSHLRSVGARVFELRTTPSGRLMTVQDPEGNLVNLVEPGSRMR